MCSLTELTENITNSEMLKQLSGIYCSLIIKEIPGNRLIILLLNIGYKNTIKLHIYSTDGIPINREIPSV